MAFLIANKYPLHTSFFIDMFIKEANEIQDVQCYSITPNTSFCQLTFQHVETRRMDGLPMRSLVCLKLALYMEKNL